ncbi:MAG TPA: hypothetical protein VH591_18750 [Ktedonobacterales bacterium]|jgi:hypothetical protein
MRHLMRHLSLRRTVFGPAIMLAIMVAMLAVLSACGASTVTVTVGTTPGATATSASGATTPASSTPASASSSNLPAYQPSSVVSQENSYTLLHSPNSVSAITAFYTNALAQGGWHVTSTQKTPTSTNLIAVRGSTGTTILIANTGNGTSISVTTYAV